MSAELRNGDSLYFVLELHVLGRSLARFKTSVQCPPSMLWVTRLLSSTRVSAKVPFPQCPVFVVKAIKTVSREYLRWL